MEGKAWPSLSLVSRLALLVGMAIVLHNVSDQRLMIYGILTTPDRVSSRDAIRTTWMLDPGVCRGFSHARGEPCHITAFFVLCKVPDYWRATIEAENSTYGDIVELPCTENMNSGKTYTWFAFAAWRFPHAAYFAKGDYDTYLYVDEIVSSLNNFPSGDALVYAGTPVDYITCGSEVFCPQGWTYMGGQFYIMSRGLAELVLDPSKTQVRAFEKGHEDLVTGDWIHSTRLPVFHYQWHRDHLPWVHPVKSPANFLRLRKLQKVRANPFEWAGTEVNLDHYS